MGYNPNICVLATRSKVIIETPLCGNDDPRRAPNDALWVTVGSEAVFCDIHARWWSTLHPHDLPPVPKPAPLIIIDPPGRIRIRVHLKWQEVEIFIPRTRFVRVVLLPPIPAPPPPGGPDPQPFPTPPPPPPVAPPPPTGSPSVPQSLTAVPGDRSVTVSWQPSANAGSSQILSYTIQVLYGGGLVNTYTTLGATVLSHVFTGLTNGLPYTFSIVASNQVGSGPATVSGIVTPGSIPSPPTNVTATPGNGQATVSWTPSTNTGGSSISSYTVRASTGQTVTTADGTTTQVVVPGLTNGAQVTFTVHATNVKGSSPESASSQIVIPYGSPGAPTNIYAEPRNQSAVVTWSPPLDNGGSPVTSYTVVSNPGGYTKTVLSITNSATVQGLANGIPYTFSVIASNARGNSVNSGPSNSVVPINPLTPPGAPQNIQAMAGNHQATVAWDPPSFSGGSAITGYTVTSSPGGIQVTVDGNTTLTVLTGLTNTQPYTFTVHATNAQGTSGESVPSNSVTPVTPVAQPPNTPTNVRATLGGPGTAVVTWNAPTSDGGAPITGYTVTATPGGMTKVLLTPTPLSATFEGLINETTVYTFTVRATNSVADSVESAISNPVTPQATFPDPPTNVVASGSDGQATVTWTPPASDGGSPLIDYTISPYPPLNSGPVVIPAPATSAVVEGLTNGQAYTFSVHVRTLAGLSPESLDSNLVIPDIARTFPDVTTTGFPNGVSLTPSSGATLTKNGQVLDAVDVGGVVHVRANNCTIRRSRITARGAGPLVRQYPGYTGLQIQDTELAGDDIAGPAFEWHDATLLRCNIHHVSFAAIANQNTVIQDSYIHDLVPDLLTDCIQNTGGEGKSQDLSGSNGKILHSTIQYGGKSIVSLITLFGPIDSVEIGYSLLDGLGTAPYCLVAKDGQSGHGVVTHLNVHNNHFKGWSQSAALLSSGSQSTLTWTNNVKDLDLSEVLPTYQ